MADDDLMHTLARFDWIAVIVLLVALAVLGLTGNAAYPNW